MKIWKINLTEKRVCYISPDRSNKLTWLPLQKIRPKGSPAFEIETKQQPTLKKKKKKSPIRAMVALKISKKHHPWWYQPYNLPSWRQIKTLTNQTKNLVSQQKMPQSPKSLTMLTLLACASSAQTEPINHTYWTYIPIPPLLQVVK